MRPDTTPITASIVFTVADMNFPVTLVFDPLKPFEVMIDFNQMCREEACPGHNIEWYIGRDLLNVGVDSETWVGEGDVAIRRDNHSQMAMVLRSKGGSATMTFPRAKFALFMARCSDLVPEGTEMDGFNWDEFDEERVTW
jgi:hypothetical protein